jgi:long-subunit acyl-CoA synthetase (AMP-forming)
MIELNPTFLAGVPRYFEKVHEGMEATDQSAKT